MVGPLEPKPAGAAAPVAPEPPPPGPPPVSAPTAATAAPDLFVGSTESSARERELKKLGVEPATLASRILKVLGPDRFAEIKAVEVPGRIAWFNPELARTLGFDVPPTNQLTPELEEQLLEALSFRVLKEGEDPSGRRVITMYADRYGGDGIGKNKGAGRAAFFAERNLNVKGVGVTPLSVADAGDFIHSHGGAPMREGLLEAIWGEVSSNLFLHGSTRILAVIDTGDVTVFPDGGREKRALIVRAGDQIRPAHLLSQPGESSTWSARILIDAAKDGGFLVTKKDGAPDLAATMRVILDRHARTAAEQVRWRILHGALSTSNMELDGSQLDLATITSQPRTAPIKVLDFAKVAFGEEHVRRAAQLQRTWDAIRGSLNQADKARMNATPLTLATEMEDSYRGHLQVQMVKAAGFGEGLAQELAKGQPDLVRRYTNALLELSALRNPGSILADKQVIEDVAVADVFHLLRKLPKELWTVAEASAGPSLNERARALLRPIIRGTPAEERATSQKLDKLVARLVPLYQQLMARALEKASDWYDDVAVMKRAVVARAELENQPIDELYRAKLSWSLIQAIEGYEHTKDRRVFEEAVDKTVALSIRNVDALMLQGGLRPIEGGVELERRTIDGVSYSVRALEGAKRRLHVEIPIEPREGGAFRLPTLEGSPVLSTAQIEALRYRYTTDAWQSFQEAPCTIEGGAVCFDLPALRADAGRLEGVFHSTAGGELWVKDGSSNFRGYTYAIPDERELARIKKAAS